MSQVIQIVPALPPRTDGIGDYAATVGNALWRDYGCRSNYLVLKGTTDASQPWHPLHAGTVRTSARDQESIEAELNRLLQSAFSPILLQYCGYGYQSRGMPRSLVKAVIRVRKQQGCQLAVMFHELFAAGPPWSSSFWASPIQEYLARELASQADSVLTNCEAHATTLKRWTNQDVHTAPVPSNVGELADPQSLAARPPVAIVFGQLGGREKTYSQFGTIEGLLGSLEISKIIDIGPGTPKNLPTGRDVSLLGVCPADEISQHLRHSRLGILSYATHCLSKSTVLAAFASHGLLVALNPIGERSSADLLPNIHFVLNSHAAPDIRSAELIARNLFSWYAQHTISAQARLYARLLLS